MALLGFAGLSSADQGQLEGLARSLAPTAFVEIDEGYQDGGFYAFSQCLGYGAAFLVALVVIGFGLQVVAEEEELRQLIVQSGRSLRRRRSVGILAFSLLTVPIAIAGVAGLIFTRDTGSPEVPAYGHTALAFVLVAMVASAVLGVLHARES